MTENAAITEAPAAPIEDWGVQTVFKDNVDNLAAFTTQDVEPILEANKADYNSGNKGVSQLGFMRKVGEIPFVVYQKWMDLYGVDALDKNHAPAVKRLLNSNEWRYLRTAPGRL